MKKTLGIFIGIIILIVVFLLLGPFYIVQEGTQVVITRMGEVVGTKTNAGLYFKIPILDVINTYPKLILSLDGDAQKLQTKENQFIFVDTTCRWKINDVKLFYQTFKTLDAAYNRISDVIDSATRTIVSQNRLSEIVRSSNMLNDKYNSTENLENDYLKETAIEIENVFKGRRQLSVEMADEARKTLEGYGINLIDIVPRQIKYADEMTESVYSRMIKERNQIAQLYRSEGEGKKAEWLGKLENEKRSIMSDAYRRAEEIKGSADAEATKIYAQSYSKDPEFYSFWKSMESYKETIPQFDATFSTDMEYFKYLYSSRAR
ncbi:MAG: protease modulator HflC [Treponema sp.]|nr:protease modulator HflC [Treponema sp.]